MEYLESEHRTNAKPKDSDDKILLGIVVGTTVGLLMGLFIDFPYFMVTGTMGSFMGAVISVLAQK